MRGHPFRSNHSCTGSSTCASAPLLAHVRGAPAEWIGVRADGPETASTATSAAAAASVDDTRSATQRRFAMSSRLRLGWVARPRAALQTLVRLLLAPRHLAQVERGRPPSSGRLCTTTTCCTTSPRAAPKVEAASDEYVGQHGPLVLASSEDLADRRVLGVSGRVRVPRGDLRSSKKRRRRPYVATGRGARDSIRLVRSPSLNPGEALGLRRTHVRVQCGMTQNTESERDRTVRLTKALQAAVAELGLARASGNRHRIVDASAAHKRALSAYEADPQLGKDPRLTPAPT